MDEAAKEPAGVTRGQNVVQVMPPDWSAAADILSTLVDRLELGRAETQLLVITADSEQASAAAHAIVSAAGDRDVRVVAASASPRATRLLKAGAPHVITGAPAELAALMRSSALKVDAVRGVVFGWLDSILGTADAEPLENLLGELPKEGARVVLAADLTSATEALIERYARRARRSVEVQDDDERPVNVQFVTTSTASRDVTLRRLLDALDLPRAEIHARSDEVRTSARAVVRALGYENTEVRVVGDEEREPSSDPLVLLELPGSRERLRSLVGEGARTVYALVQPSQLASLRGMLGGGSATPVALLEAAERARGRDAALRASLREVLVSSDVRRETLALEPLLAEFDGLEIAAAALRMLEQQRPARPAQAAPQVGAVQRLFINLGEKDGVRAQELITAISNEAGIPSSQIGKIEVRDTHSIVEIAAGVAELVATKMTGSAVRGRRVQARIDAPREDHPARPAGPRGPRPGGDRGDRGDRPARPARPFDRDRPARPGANRSRDAGPPRGGAPRPGARDGAPRNFDRPGGSSRPTRSRPPRDNA